MSATGLQEWWDSVDLKMQADSCSGDSKDRRHSANSLRPRYNFQETDMANCTIRIGQAKEDPWEESTEHSSTPENLSKGKEFSLLSGPALNWELKLWASSNRSRDWDCQVFLAKLKGKCKVLCLTATVAFSCISADLSGTRPLLAPARNRGLPTFLPPRPEAASQFTQFVSQPKSETSPQRRGKTRHKSYQYGLLNE